MHRITPALVVVALGLSVTPATPIGQAQPSTAVATLRPLQRVPGAKARNIVFILADDHRYDAMGFMGHPVVKTPNLDLMARQGAPAERVRHHLALLDRHLLLVPQHRRDADPHRRRSAPAAAVSAGDDVLRGDERLAATPTNTPRPATVPIGTSTRMRRPPVIGRVPQPRALHARRCRAAADAAVNPGSPPGCGGSPFPRSAPASRSDRTGCSATPRGL
jgi:hypothetical protein